MQTNIGTIGRDQPFDSTKAHDLYSCLLLGGGNRRKAKLRLVLTNRPGKSFAKETRNLRHPALTFGLPATSHSTPFDSVDNEQETLGGGPTRGNLTKKNRVVSEKGSKCRHKEIHEGKTKENSLRCRADANFRINRGSRPIPACEVGRELSRNSQIARKPIEGGWGRQGFCVITWDQSKNLTLSQSVLLPRALVGGRKKKNGSRASRLKHPYCEFRDEGRR